MDVLTEQHRKFHVRFLYNGQSIELGANPVVAGQPAQQFKLPLINYYDPFNFSVDVEREVERAVNGDVTVTDGNVEKACFTELLMWLFNSVIKDNAEQNADVTNSIHAMGVIFDTDVNGRLRMFIGKKKDAQPANMVSRLLSGI